MGEQPARCASCGARIRWVDIDGKRLPLNYARVRAYQAGRHGTFEQLKDGAVGGPLLVYVSHFVSCPQTAEYSKGGR